MVPLGSKEARLHLAAPASPSRSLVPYRLLRGLQSYLFQGWQQMRMAVDRVSFLSPRWQITTIAPSVFLKEHTVQLDLKNEQEQIVQTSFELTKDVILRPYENSLNGKSLLEHLKELRPDLRFKGETLESDARVTIPLLINKNAQDFQVSLEESCRLLFLLVSRVELATYSQQFGYHVCPVVKASDLEASFQNAACLPQDLLKERSGLQVSVTITRSLYGKGVDFQVSQTVTLTTIGEEGCDPIPSQRCIVEYDSISRSFEEKITPLNCRSWVFEVLSLPTS